MLGLHTKLIAIILMFSLGAYAQQESEFAVKLDSTIHNKWIPTGVRFGIDIAGPIYNQFEPKISNYEVMADVDFGKFFGVVEIGKGAYNSNDAVTNYSNSGLFFRGGADINMTARDASLNVLYFGLRYATSNFSESLKADLPSNGWGTTLLDLEQQNSLASWIEMNMGLRIRIWKSIFMGYTLRFKLLKHNTFNQGKFETYFIPGYGLASNTSNWGISYYIQYRIEWNKKPIPWKAD
jgi:uncharacterized protein DUF6048